MKIQAITIPRAMLAGACLSLLAMMLGFILGGIFGAAEDSVMRHLDDSGTAVLQSVYQGDSAAKDAVVDKSWEYLTRAHLHGGAIGSAALGSILALILLCRPGLLAKLSALAFGTGALLLSPVLAFRRARSPRIGRYRRCQGIAFVCCDSGSGPLYPGFIRHHLLCHEGLFLFIPGDLTNAWAPLLRSPPRRR